MPAIKPGNLLASSQFFWETNFGTVGAIGFIQVRAYSDSCKKSGTENETSAII